MFTRETVSQTYTPTHYIQPITSTLSLRKCWMSGIVILTLSGYFQVWGKGPLFPSEILSLSIFFFFFLSLFSQKVKMFLRTLTGFAVNSKINTLGREVGGWVGLFIFYLIWNFLSYKNSFALFDFWNEVANVLGAFFFTNFLNFIISFYPNIFEVRISHH